MSGGGALAGRLEPVRAAARIRAAPRDAGVVLVYHGVSESGDDPREHPSPALRLSTFETHLGVVAQSFDVVALSDLLARATRRRVGARPLAAITFDDDLSSHLELAAPALGRRGLPATFFLTGASLEAPRRMWWDQLREADELVPDRLDAALARLGLPGRSAGLPVVAGAVRDLPPAERRRLGALLEAELPEAVAERGLAAADVRRLADLGFDIGFHTRDHDLLTGLDDRTLTAAMRDGRDAVEDAASRRLATIAYPHGGADARVARAARAAGYEMGVTTAGRAVTSAEDRWLLPRIELHAETPGAVLRSLANVFPSRRPGWA